MSSENFHLITRRGPKPGQTYPLLAATITLGRDPMSDIVIQDPEISRYHAQLIQTESGYQIQDMGSTNGTFVAGQRLGSDPVALSPGQTIAFGSGVVMAFEVGSVEEGQSMVTMVEASPEAPLVTTEVSSPPIPLAPNRPQQTAQPFVPPADEEAARKKRRNIILVVVLIVLCCCCAFPLSGWFVWGDPLLDLLQQQEWWSQLPF